MKLDMGCILSLKEGLGKHPFKRQKPQESLPWLMMSCRQRREFSVAVQEKAVGRLWCVGIRRSLVADVSLTISFTSRR